jgi:thioredoxin-dependent peroxiredoxin
MASITLGGKPIHTSGDLFEIGTQAPDFTLVKNDFSRVSLKDFMGSRIVMNIFPSIETGVCANSVRTFNKQAAGLKNTKVLCISRDLPFTQANFCAVEGIENAITLSDFETGDFAVKYKLNIIDGPWAGLCSRVVIVLDETGKVIYKEQVPEIGQEPNYQAAIEVLL